MRGDIFELRNDRHATGGEQQGDRFCVVVQDDYIARPTVIVVPTSRSAGPADFRPEIVVNGLPTRALAEQVTTFDLSRLKERVGRVNPDEMTDIEHALRDVLGLF